MKIDPRTLVQLAEIVEQQSFSRAATRLGTTQPALSKMVATLEKRLGAAILAQRRRPVIPTELGRQLAESGLIIGATLANVSRLTTEHVTGSGGHLRVGAPPFMCDSVMSASINSFRARLPGVSFEMTPGYSRRMRELVHQNQLDIAFVALEMQEDRFNLATTELSMQRHAIVCRSGNPILDRDAITIHDLEQAEWISHAGDSTLHRIMRNCLSSAGVMRIRPTVISEASGAIFNLLLSSNSLTVLPIFSVIDLLESGELTILPINAPAENITLGAVTVGKWRLVNLFQDHFGKYIRAIEGRVVDFQKRHTWKDASLLANGQNRKDFGHRDR